MVKSKNFFDKKRKGTRIKPWGAPRFEKGVLSLDF